MIIFRLSYLYRFKGFILVSDKREYQNKWASSPRPFVWAVLNAPATISSLLGAELLSCGRKKLLQLKPEVGRVGPCCGEINYQVKAIQQFWAFFSGIKRKPDETDVIRLECADWRPTFRVIPLFKLNVETWCVSPVVFQHLPAIEVLIGNAG